MLESRGHHVTSVLGNDEVFGMDAAVIAAAESIVIGFSAPRPVRAPMIHWFKQHYPNTPVVVLRLPTGESFPEADGGTVSDDPEVWLAAVASTPQKISVIKVHHYSLPTIAKGSQLSEPHKVQVPVAF